VNIILALDIVEMRKARIEHTSGNIGVQLNIMLPAIQRHNLDIDIGKDE
jgi:hypothetical protein